MAAKYKNILPLIKCGFYGEINKIHRPITFYLKKKLHLNFVF